MIEQEIKIDEASTYVRYIQSEQIEGSTFNCFTVDLWITSSKHRAINELEVQCSIIGAKYQNILKNIDLPKGIYYHVGTFSSIVDHSDSLEKEIEIDTNINIIKEVDRNE